MPQILALCRPRMRTPQADVRARAHARAPALRLSLGVQRRKGGAFFSQRGIGGARPVSSSGDTANSRPPRVRLTQLLRCGWMRRTGEASSGSWLVVASDGMASPDKGRRGKYLCGYTCSSPMRCTGLVSGSVQVFVPRSLSRGTVPVPSRHRTLLEAPSFHCCVAGGCGALSDKPVK